MNHHDHPNGLYEPMGFPLREDTHIIEASDDEEDPVADAEEFDDHDRLQDALEAWNEMSCLARSVGAYLMGRQMSNMRKRAREITERQQQQQQRGSLHLGNDNVSCESLPKPERKRRRLLMPDVEGTVSTPVRTLQQQLLLQQQPLSVEEQMRALDTSDFAKKVDRMKRMSRILRDLNSAHVLMHREISSLLSEVREEESSCE